MIGVPITLPNVPTFVTVKVPPWISSGLSLLLRALFANSFTAFVMPTRFKQSAFLITGTIRFPEGSAVAIPILMSLRLMIVVPLTETLIIGKSLMAFTIASMKIGVNVMFSFSRFKKSPFTLFLQLTMFVTSASTYDVTCGATCTDITMCSAINLRMRSISMISSPGLGMTTGPLMCAWAVFSCGTGATFGASTTAFGAAAAAGIAGAVPRFSTYDRISFFVTRPPCPVPAMFSSSCIPIPSFSAMLRTSGE